MYTKKQKMLKGHLPSVIYITKFTSIRRLEFRGSGFRLTREVPVWRIDGKFFFFFITLEPGVE